MVAGMAARPKASGEKNASRLRPNITATMAAIRRTNPPITTAEYAMREILAAQYADGQEDLRRPDRLVDQPAHPHAGQQPTEQVTDDHPPRRYPTPGIVGIGLGSH